MAELELINDEITILYKIEFEDRIEGKVRIFGRNFVKNNKNKCKIIIDEKKYEIKEELNINKEKIIEIKLIEINNITDMSYMFSGCSSLSNLPDISKWNINKHANISFMFIGCSSLKSLPDLSKWDITYIRDISFLFYNCSSLTL